MIYHQKNSGTMRIHSSASHPTTPDTWNMKIVGQLVSAVEASTWQHVAVRKSSTIGVECWKGLVFEPSYLIPIELNSKAIRIV